MLLVDRLERLAGLSSAASFVLLPPSFSSSQATLSLHDDRDKHLCCIMTQSKRLAEPSFVEPWLLLPPSSASYKEHSGCIVTESKS